MSKLEDVVPLSPLQQGLHSLSTVAAPSETEHDEPQVDPDAYTVQSVLRLTGDVDARRLHASVQALLDRHAALRTCFRPRKDGRAGLVVKDIEVPWRSVDLSSTADRRRPSPLSWTRTCTLVRPHRPSTGPLDPDPTRRRRRAPAAHRAHTVVDGWPHPSWCANCSRSTRPAAARRRCRPSGPTATISRGWDGRTTMRRANSGGKSWTASTDRRSSPRRVHSRRAGHRRDRRRDSRGSDGTVDGSGARHRVSPSTPSCRPGGRCCSPVWSAPDIVFGRRCPVARRTFRVWNRWWACSSTPSRSGCGSTPRRPSPKRSDVSRRSRPGLSTTSTWDWPRCNARPVWVNCSTRSRSSSRIRRSRCARPRPACRRGRNRGRRRGGRHQLPLVLTAGVADRLIIRLDYVLPFSPRPISRLWGGAWSRS